ncbi:uncharacterized protein LOC131652980 [Vicia villosa]|uniref:uncharacterized protein LOC131652980 n=1 Tax=Vicia villosa TaxID=3911 RepID=UPI00273BBA9D|nr:uncharacterized protein LOC131652980 [Vicia villosa]
MAADQKRKRVNGASIVGYGSREQHRTKRKNPGLVPNDMRSHISVEWDRNQKIVVAKREQIGISWRQMKPFVNYVSNDHKVLADVFTVPQEIFDLDNLSEVLSYEVWNTHLSENERNLLMSFLPRGIEPQQAVEDLLAGTDFEFGNPFLNWGASLCSGDLHPDIIVNREQRLKSEKRAYYKQLHNYHNGMIGFLSKLKERWQSCRDPEKDILQKMWRPKHVPKRIPSNVNESRVNDHDRNVAVTSESCSWDTEEKACSSEYRISSSRKDDQLQKKVLEKGIVKGKSRNSMFTSDGMHIKGEKPNKEDKVLERNIHFIDGDKYMSCIKVSRKQHELVKSMKQSGKSIQSKSLNHVLGNLDEIHVQPYEVFVKEEQKKLHEHWLQLVIKDLPVACANKMQRQIQRDAMRNSLVEEMKDKSSPLFEEEDNLSLGMELQDQDVPMSLGDEPEDQDEDDISPVEDPNEDVSSGGKLQDQNEDSISPVEDQHEGVSSGSELQDQDEDTVSPVEDQNEDVSSGGELHDQDEDNMGSEEELQNVVEDGRDLNDLSSMKDYEDSVVRAPEIRSSHDSYSSCNDHFNKVSMDSEKNIVLSKSDDTSPNKDEYPRNTNICDVSTDEGAPFTSGSDVWQTVEMAPHSYYDSAATNKYTANGLSLVNSQVNEDPRTHVIDLEADLHQEETGKELLHGHLDNGTSFSSYESQSQGALIHSLFNGEGLLPYHHEQKGAPLDFQTSNNIMMGDGQCSSHFKEPLQMPLMLDSMQRRATEVYMPESMSENIHSIAGGRYLIPRQDPFIPRQDSLAVANVTDWAPNTASMATPSQSHLNTGNFIGHHWPPANHHIRGGWNGSDGSSLSSQSVGTGSNSDQSLFSMLSHCNQLRPGSSYDSVRNPDQFLTPRTYGVDAGITRVNPAVLPQASHPLDYLTAREAAPSVMVPDDMTWMNLQHPNSVLHDPTGKPYLKSWHR